MELTNHEKQMLNNAVIECVKHADCERLERVFDAAEWTWADPIGDEEFSPTAREIRTELYRLGNDLKDRLIKSYKAGEWVARDPLPFTVECGRLYFSFRWDVDEDTDADFIKDITLVCGIKTDSAITSIIDVTDDTFSVDTYADMDNEYREVFDKIGD